jgi:hypothetical protein
MLNMVSFGHQQYSPLVIHSLLKFGCKDLIKGVDEDYLVSMYILDSLSIHFQEVPNTYYPNVICSKGPLHKDLKTRRMVDISRDLEGLDLSILSIVLL